MLIQFRPKMYTNHIKKIFLLIFIVIFFGSNEAVAQKFLLLQKGSNQKTRLKYEIGENITYKSKTNDFFITDKIVDIQNDILVLTENVLRPEDIVSIDILRKDPRNSTLKNLSALGMAGGFIFLLADGVNGLYQEGKPSIGQGTMVTSGIMIGSGFILSRIRYRHFDNKGRNKIQLIVLYGE